MQPVLCDKGYIYVTVSNKNRPNEFINKDIGFNTQCFFKVHKRFSIFY